MSSQNMYDLLVNIAETVSTASVNIAGSVGTASVNIAETVGKATVNIGETVGKASVNIAETVTSASTSLLNNLNLLAPPPGLLVVPLKLPGDVELIKVLEPVMVAGMSLDELQRMRVKMVLAIKNQDYSDGTLQTMQSYYDQLSNLETKIPFSQVEVNLGWVDAFEKKSWLGGKTENYPCSNSLHYEKACVLFNIGALSTQIAKAQDLDEEEGLKKSTKLLQSCAGVFSALSAMMPQITTKHQSTPDLYPEALAALSWICLAQAQEVILKKVVKDKKKNNTVASVAANAEDLYGEAGRLLGNESLKMVWEWTAVVEKKRALHGGLAQLYQAKVCKETKRIGEEISRLRRAVSLLTIGNIITGEWLALAQANLEEANKDNNFIYNEEVPDVEKLPKIERAMVARMITLPDKFMENSKDLFEDVKTS